MVKTLLGAVGVAAFCTCSAFAGNIYHFDWNEGDNAVNNNGGVFKNITASFNENTNDLNWSTTFGDAPNGRKTNGFTLVVNNGPNPKNHPGQYAIFYFDASDTSDPILTVYGYNGQNGTSSFYDGNGAQGGNQTPDFILSSQTGNTSWVNALSVVDNGDGTRTLSMDIDATAIKSHDPLYPDPQGDPWFGTGWGSKLGLWFHPFTGLRTDYNQHGKLTRWDFRSHGWFDAQNLNTTVIPLPAPVLLGIAGLGLVWVARGRSQARG